MVSNYRAQEEIKEGFEIYDNSFESMLRQNPKLVQCVMLFYFYLYFF